MLFNAMVSSEYIHTPGHLNALQLLSVLDGRSGGLSDAPSCGPSPNCRSSHIHIGSSRLQVPNCLWPSWECCMFCLVVGLSFLCCSTPVLCWNDWMGFACMVEMCCLMSCLSRFSLAKVLCGSDLGSDRSSWKFFWGEQTLGTIQNVCSVQCLDEMYPK